MLTHDLNQLAVTNKQGQIVGTVSHSVVARNLGLSSSKVQQCKISGGFMPTSPRLWANPPGNSPLPLPSGPVFFSSRELSELSFPEMPDVDSIDLKKLRDFIGGFTFENGKSVSDVIDLNNRRPLWIWGELCKPLPSFMI